MKKYNLIIIGAGAAGFAAAIKANELGAKTLLVNSGLPLGGTCVNVGCVPSKTLLWAGEIIHQAKNHGIPGINFELKEFDFAKIVGDEIALTKKLRAEKYEKVLTNLPKVTLVEGKASFVDNQTVKIDGQNYQAEKFIIANGSTANVPPIEGIAQTGYLTHIEALEIKKLPKSMAVVGAGPLGLEFAQAYARFGTKVTIIERGPTIFGGSEPELTARLAEVLNNEDIEIFTNTQVKKAGIRDGQKVLDLANGEKKFSVAADEILLAAGKTANTKNLGLEKAGVKVNERQGVVVNDYYQTSAKHIFAAGDVAALPLRLEITAGKEGTLAAENGLTASRQSIDYQSVPFTIFTDPSLAGVGLTDAAAIKKGFSCSCRTVSFEQVPKALIMRRTEGLIKMVADQKTKRILGIHILAPQAGELIATAMTLVKNQITVDQVVKSLPMFPTLSESIKLSALAYTKNLNEISCCI